MAGARAIAVTTGLHTRENFAGRQAAERPDVTPAGLAVFALISADPGVRPGIISEELRVKPSNVAALVNSPVAAGLVQRMVDASELRASLLHATKFGAKARQEMGRTHREMDLRFTGELAAPERKQFVALLRKLLHR